MGFFSRKTESPTPSSESLRRAEREVAEAQRRAAAARLELEAWRERRPQVEATGRAIRDQMAKNHLSELLLASMRGH